MHNAVLHTQARLSPEIEWRKMMTKGLLSMTAVAAILLGTPALAADRPEPTAPAASAPVTAAPQKNVRYCAEGEITGSRIPRRICKTRADWLKQGVDPLAK
jgi:hypothetical protein